MKFLALSDTHGKHRLLKELSAADVIIHAGDHSSSNACSPAQFQAIT
jgi:predicted phosphodiesterase